MLFFLFLRLNSYRSNQSMFCGFVPKLFLFLVIKVGKLVNFKFFSHRTNFPNVFGQVRALSILNFLNTVKVVFIVLFLIVPFQTIVVRKQKILSFIENGFENFQLFNLFCTSSMIVGQFRVSFALSIIHQARMLLFGICFGAVRILSVLGIF